MCEEATLKDKHLMTKMLRGRAQGKFIHQRCAQLWYSQNPTHQGSQTEPSLKFSFPQEEHKAFMDSFVKGTARVFHLGGTAGGGKSSKIIYGAHRLRAEAITFRVVVFSVKAKEELQERGLTANECINFHAFFMRAYRLCALTSTRLPCPVPCLHS